jgi:NTE family protein
MFKKFLLILFCIVTATAFAQEKPKPKVGVVLSGGGAKGLAHIGVLKVLEEAGVEVSYIGGTSMGAIIGGLYASGYSAKELDSIFNEVDADALLQDYTPRSSKNFFEKRNDEVYALTLPFKNFRLGFPAALSKGLYNYTLLNELTNHVRHVRDFSKLPIPFVCIATDIETGEEIVLKYGVLPDAILASGAFPSLYYPVEIDDRLLIDGGITNNYPVEEVRKMGADIIIGVDVQDGLKTRDQIKGATGVLVQINNYQMIEKMEEKRKQTDIYIKPDITAYNVIAFDQGREIINEGEIAARKILDTLKKLGYVNEIRREKVILDDTIHLEYIKVNKLKNYTRSYVLGKLNIKSGAKVTYTKLNEGISNLNATQNFNSISYSFKKGAEGDVLDLQLKENPIDTYLKFGLHYDGLYKSGILLNLTHKKLFFKNDIASVDVVLGDNFRYYFDYFLDNGFHISYGVRSYYTQFNRNISADYSVGELLELFGLSSINFNFSDLTTQAYMQTIFAHRFMIAGGAELKHIKIKSETIPGIEPILENSTFFSAFANIKLDSYDNKFFPTEGWFFNGEAKWYLSSTDYTEEFSRFGIIKGELGTAKTLTENLTLKLEAETGLTIGEETVSTFDFIFGGYGYFRTNNFRHFYGYDFLSISGNSYIKGLVTIDYEFIKKNHINFSANYANMGHNLYDEGEILSIPKYSGYAFGYGMETIIGPIEIKHSWSPETKDHFTWFSVGFWF